MIKINLDPNQPVQPAPKESNIIRNVIILLVLLGLIALVVTLGLPLLKHS